MRLTLQKSPYSSSTAAPAAMIFGTGTFTRPARRILFRLCVENFKKKNIKHRSKTIFFILLCCIKFPTIIIIFKLQLIKVTKKIKDNLTIASESCHFQNTKSLQAVPEVSTTVFLVAVIKIHVIYMFFSSSVGDKFNYYLQSRNCSIPQ